MAWVELNYRPHAYQAGSHQNEFGSEVHARPPFTNILLSISDSGTSCALPRTFCASEWTPRRTPAAIHTVAVHFRGNFALSSSNQFSTMMMLSGDFVSSGRIIRNR